MREVPSGLSRDSERGRAFRRHDRQHGHAPGRRAGLRSADSGTRARTMRTPTRRRREPRPPRAGLPPVQLPSDLGRSTQEGYGPSALQGAETSSTRSRPGQGVAIGGTRPGSASIRPPLRLQPGRRDQPGPVRLRVDRGARDRARPRLLLVCGLHRVRVDRFSQLLRLGPLPLPSRRDRPDVSQRQPHSLFRRRAGLLRRGDLWRSRPAGPTALEATGTSQATGKPTSSPGRTSA